MRAVVFTGAGERAFCAGGDLKERDGHDRRDLARPARRSSSRRRSGAALPGARHRRGRGLRPGRRLRAGRCCPTSSWRARRRSSALPETTLGIFPGIGGTQFLPRVLGAPLAKELIFTGRRVKADEAKAAGLVNHVVPAGQARAKALEIAATIAANGPVAVRQAKKAIAWGARPTSDRPSTWPSRPTMRPVDHRGPARRRARLQREAQAGSKDGRAMAAIDRSRSPTSSARSRPASADICKKYPGEYWRDLDAQARVPRGLRQRADPGRLPGRADPRRSTAGPARHHRGRADPRDDQRARAATPPPATPRCTSWARCCGTAARRRSRQYLPKIATGELRLQAFGVTEPNAGSDTTKLQTTAVRKGDRYVVNGQKMFISRALQSDLMLLLARTTPVDKVKQQDARAVASSSSTSAASGPRPRDPPAAHDDEPLHQRALLRRHGDPRRQPDRRGGQGLRATSSTA